MANAELSELHDLFGFGKVCHVALVVDPPRVVAGPGFLVGSARNYCAEDPFVSGQEAVVRLDVALDDGAAPLLEQRVGGTPNGPQVKDELLIVGSLLGTGLLLVEMVG